MVRARNMAWMVLLLAIAILLTSRADAQRREGEGPRGDRLKRMINEWDKDGDGQISKDEFTGPERMFERGDSDGDGILTSEELEALGKRMRRGGRREDNAPKVGAEAPDFTLKSLDGESEFHLADFRDTKPVVLFFGSYT